MESPVRRDQRVKAWLEVERDSKGVAVGLGEKDRWMAREFASYS